MSKSRAARRRRSSSIGKARNGRVTQPLTMRAPYWLVFTDCSGCSLCDELSGSSDVRMTIHRLPEAGGDDWSPYSEEPGATNSGPLFDQTPSLTWSDLPWKV
jgi:hypothetical protein